MRRGNRRRRRSRRRSRAATRPLDVRASAAGRQAAGWVEQNARSLAASARRASGRVVAGIRGLADCSGSAGRRHPVKRGATLGRRMGEVASSLHGRGFILWSAALVTGLLCVWQHVHSNELALEIERLRNAREAVETEIGLLEMECAELSKRKRIEEYASERLGMRYPRAGEVIWLEPSASGSRAGDRGGYVMGEADLDAEG